MIWMISLTDAAQKTFYLFSIFVITIIFFSSSQNRWGRSMRCLCGIFISLALFTSFPPEFGLPAAVLAILVFVGGLLSVWSGMSLNNSIVWFTKRSFRKETVFLIMFVTGVTAIGLGQAQSYANRRLGQSGLAQSLAPGSVTRLALSSELALQIYFPDAPPAHAASVYIRANSLDQSMGLDWAPSSSKILTKIPEAGDDLNYSVSLSPRHMDFTPVIDYGVGVFDPALNRRTLSPRDNGAFVGGGFTSGWRQYKAISRNAPVHGLEDINFKNLLTVGGQVESDVRDLARTLARQPSDLQNFLENLSNYFKRSGFVYSLSLASETKDLKNFLFGTKVGFCEHYAAASATIGRLAGYPARVVTGFQGGFFDESSSTLYVRDLDSHAWTEFWDKTQSRWVRYDPVAYVAPSRIDQGAAYFLRSNGYSIPADVEFASRLWFTRAQIELDDFLSGLSSNLSQQVGQSVIEYGEELALIGVFGLTMSYVFLVYRRRRRMREQPELAVINMLQKYFERRQLGRGKGEPVSVWLDRCAVLYDVATKEEIAAFVECHSRFCHGRSHLDEDLRAMRRLARVITRSKMITSNSGERH
jgi:transglutaminase-like putative cysteine protease/NADH:ubiquinone oxidoreductase subunit 6 (subunit J)